MRCTFFVLISAIFFSGCKNPVDKLPELAQAEADSLALVKENKIWATAANIFNNDLPPVRDTVAQSIACADKNDYRIWVYYPITICTYPAEILNAQTASLFNGNDSIIKRINSRDRLNSFRLSKSNRLGTETSLWCRRLDGPWVAEVSETQQCNNPELYKTIVVLTGVPNQIRFEWWGTFGDKAAQMGLQATGMLFGLNPGRVKCSSLTACN